MSDSPAYALLLTLEDRHLAELEALLALHDEDGAERILIDRSTLGISADRVPAGVVVVRPAMPAAEDGIAAALALATAPVACVRVIDGAYAPGHAPALVAALGAGDARFATSTYGLVGAKGEVLHVVDPAQDGERPPPLFTGALALRTDVAVGATAFFPNLLAAYRAALADGAVATVPESGFQISMDRFAAARFGADRATRLVDAHKGDYGDEAPWASVMVAPSDDPEALLRTLEGLATQVLPPGLFEVLLPAGAAELVEGLSLALPVRVIDGATGGRAAALQAAVDAAVGYLGIFVDAGLEVWPSMVEHHIRAHRDRPGQLLAVVGTVEVPLVDQATAWGAAYVAADPEAILTGPATSEILPAHRFRLSNGSIPLEGVRLAGGMDRALPDAGVDLELAWRLERDGYELLVAPSARCLRGRVPTVREHGATVRAAAEAEVAVLRTSAAALDAAGCLDETAAGLEAALAPHLGVLETVVEATEGLGALGTHAVEAMGGDWSAFAQDAVDRAGKLRTHLEKVWRMQGRLAGLQAAGAAGFVDFLRDQPLALPGRRGTLYLVRPTADGEVSWLETVAHFLVGFGPVDDATLLLYADPENGGVDAEDLRTGVMELTRRLTPGPLGGWADVQVAAATGRTGELLRLAAAADGWCATGQAGDAVMAAAAEQIGLAAVESAGWVLRPTGGVDPLPLSTRARFRAFAWPDWSSDADFQALFRQFAPALANRGDAALLLRFDAATDGDPEEGLQRMADTFEAEMPEGTNLEVVLVDNVLAADDAPRLGVAVQAVLGLPSTAAGAHADFIAGMGVATVADEVSLHGALLSLPPLPMGPLYIPTMTLF